MRPDVHEQCLCAARANGELHVHLAELDQFLRGARGLSGREKAALLSKIGAVFVRDNADPSCVAPCQPSAMHVLQILNRLLSDEGTDPSTNGGDTDTEILAAAYQSTVGAVCDTYVKQLQFLAREHAELFTKGMVDLFDWLTLIWHGYGDRAKRTVICAASRLTPAYGARDVREQFPTLSDLIVETLLARRKLGGAPSETLRNLFYGLLVFWSELLRRWQGHELDHLQWTLCYRVDRIAMLMRSLEMQKQKNDNVARFESVVMGLGVGQEPMAPTGRYRSDDKHRNKLLAADDVLAQWYDESSPHDRDILRPMRERLRVFLGGSLRAFPRKPLQGVTADIFYSGKVLTAVPVIDANAAPAQSIRLLVSSPDGELIRKAKDITLVMHLPGGYAPLPPEEARVKATIVKRSRGLDAARDSEDLIMTLDPGWTRSTPAWRTLVGLP